MTSYKFKINGVDFSRFVDKTNYNTSLTPVEAARITTIDTKDHVVIARHRGGLMVGINPMNVDDAETFCSALLSSPMVVQYHSFQRGADVSETMTVDATTLRDAFNHASKRWLDGTTITFTQL